jgi:hypothetical protein
MLRWILIHHWKKIRRSPDFQRNIAVNIVIGFFVLIFFVNLLILGLSIDSILKAAAPAENPLRVLNSLLLYYFSVDLLLRFFLQKIHSLNAAPYLTLPVRRNALVHYVLGSSVLSLFNLVPLFIFVPCLWKVVALTSGPLASSAWILTLLVLMLWNGYVIVYLRNRFPAQMKIVVGLLAVVGLVFSGLIPVRNLSAGFFQLFLDHPETALVPVAMLAGIYALNWRYLRHHLSIDEMTRSRMRRSSLRTPSFLRVFGELGPYVGLELKLLTRNKRSRSMLILIPLMLAYGLLVYPHEMNRSIDGFLMIVGFMITGLFVVSYGTYAFAWESGYFGLILAGRIDIRRYIRAKYVLMLCVSLLAYLVSLGYAVFGARIILINTALLLFNLGVGAIIVLTFATFNKTRYNLDANIFSTQGKTGVHYSVILILLAIQYAVYFLFKLTISSEAGIAALGILGLVGLLFHRMLLERIVRQFLKKKYAMAAGFRQNS